ncbi:hypothetical protein C8F04DRAFT_1193253 [Mycena alexandri]|uniref:Uncharacterized protein n=1 Tax=Mycena alexandri TaxID=1745969 RepID=A0AAD6WU86_9AGAR|nr:hypothetical protein C8F04DRAFT_1193253 [Mycena alexandri]
MAYNELSARFETLNTAYSKSVDAVSDELQRPSITAPSSASSTDLVATMDTKNYLRLLKVYNEVEYWTEEEYLKEVNGRKNDKGPAKIDTQALRGGRCLADDENVMYWFVQQTAALSKRREFARSTAMPARCASCSGAASLRARLQEHCIATNIYPGWYSSYTNSNSNKIEPDVLEAAATAVVAGDSKRRAADSPDEEPSKSRSVAATSLPTASAPPESLCHGTDPPPIPTSLSSDAAAKPSTPETVPSISSSAVCAALPPTTAVPSTAAPSSPVLPAPATPPPTAATMSPVTISTPAVTDPVSSIPSAAQTTGGSCTSPACDGFDRRLPCRPDLPQAVGIEGDEGPKGEMRNMKAKESANSKSSEGGTESKPAAKITWLRATTSMTTRNICLKHYIKRIGKVTKVVFDNYYGDVSEEVHQVNDLGVTSTHVKKMKASRIIGGLVKREPVTRGRRRITCRETLK